MEPWCVRSIRVPALPGRDHWQSVRRGQLSDMQREVQVIASKPVFFCGRLANYEYIDQDQAVAQGIDTARLITSRGRLW